MLRTLIAVAVLAPASAEAALITQLDFSTPDWSSTLFVSGTATGAFTADTTARVDKTSGSGGVRLRLNLLGSISTIGFENIRLEFDGVSGDLEWNGNLTGTPNSSDGVRIEGDGVVIDASGINGTAAETDWTSGPTSFPSTNFNSDFTFAAGVDDSQISTLSFVLQVNANDEFVELTNVEIHGDAIPAVPEPSSCLLLGLGAAGLVALRRRRRSR